MRKTLRRASLTHLIEALKQLGYVFYKPPHEYKRGKFHVAIHECSQTRLELSLHRDRRRLLLEGHIPVWEGEDLKEEMNKIMESYHKF